MSFFPQCPRVRMIYDATQAERRRRRTKKEEKGCKREEMLVWVTVTSSLKGQTEEIKRFIRDGALSGRPKQNSGAVQRPQAIKEVRAPRKDATDPCDDVIS